MKISVFYEHILQAREQTGKNLEVLLEEVRAAGIEGIEINLTYLEENYEEVMRLLNCAGLHISCIYEFYEMDSCDESAKVDRHMEMAAKVGANKVLVVPGFLEESETKEMQKCAADYDELAAYMNRNTKIRGMESGLNYAVESGKRNGVVVTVEDFDDKKSPLSVHNGILWFLNRVAGLRYTLDMGNFIFYEEDVMQAWEVLQDKISHVHCKDRGEGFSSVAAGDGYMPIEELVGCLKKAGYDDYLAVEHFDAPNQEECIVKSAQFLKNTWDAAVL